MWTDNLTMDAGLAYIDGKSGNFSESSPLAQYGVPDQEFSSSGPAYIGSVQLNYTF